MVDHQMSRQPNSSLINEDRNTFANITLSNEVIKAVLNGLQTYLLIFLVFVQCSLLHPTFSGSALAKLIRISLRSINFVWLITFPFKNCPDKVELPKSFEGFLIHFLPVYLAFKSLEWGFAANCYYTRPLKEIDGMQQWEKSKGDDVTFKRAQEEEPCDVLKLFLWTLLQLTSVRGLQFDWGPAATASTESTYSLLWRMFRLNIPLTCAHVFMVATRDSPGGTPKSALVSIGVPEFFSLNFLSEALYTICFGIYLACSLDIRYTVITLGVSLLHKLAIWFGCREPILELCNPIYYPPIFNSPHKSPSLSHFWGKGWHQLFRRVFLMGGGKPMIWMANKIGASVVTQRVLGLFGVFGVSAFMHEYFACFWTPGRSSSNQIFKHFPGSFFFFIIQPFALILEPYIIPFIPKIIGGLWFWIFLVMVGPKFRDQYLYDTQLHALFPSFSQWSWKYILFPLKD
ncbi:hypothetical protein CROQUDRAFT_658148 [Cronartium quercuum f. sp. fusiforme G11]|uniref:Wax synthase domain-containing protein n=1 Tax=Cronartium quercuum f. sp. fusiforme G11 TaxID=708437 RepID=A0A9P6NH36_9BASI|nr:hypothetical protein CROQUDRAFT_658148 [Cronartium quercuum f. sp. fusiforme G11]